MLTGVDHLLAAVLVLLFPLRAAFFGLRRLQRAAEAVRPRMRRRVYATAMAIQWSLTLAVTALWIARRRPWDALGLVFHPGRGFLIVALVVAAAAVVLVAQQVRARRSDETLAHVVERLARVEAMLPHTPGEFAMFGALSLTAGVCEEVLYRGFLFGYAGHWMPAPWALALSSAVFGLGHLYQGWRGVLATAGVGALFALVYVLSGSLFLGMAAHALLDLHTGDLAHVAFTRARARAAEEARALAAAGPPPGPPEVPA